MDKLKFPEGFLWGTATSSYQVEGGIGPVRSLAHAKGASPEGLGEAASNGIENDWSEAARAGRVPAAGRACDHYNRYEGDFDIAKSLGQNAHRFSIEWARVEPEEGRFDENAVGHYRKVLQALRERGLEPFVTLWHFTLPIWFAKMGGFENKKAPFYFAKYCEYVVGRLAASAEATASQGGAGVKFWITLNEPMVYVGQGYGSGIWPPLKKDFIKLLRVVDNLITSHNIAYQKIKALLPNSQVGIAADQVDYHHNNNPLSFLQSRFMDWFRNRRFLSRTSKCRDFIGVNYYRPIIYYGKLNLEKTDMSWDIYPKGIYNVLARLKRYRKPVYITENGIADATDARRAKFIRDHLYWVNRAIHDGIDVRGYFYWSLLDNFEWAHGLGPRFGLVEMNYETMERKIRSSAYEYKRICESNSL